MTIPCEERLRWIYAYRCELPDGHPGPHQHTLPVELGLGTVGPSGMGLARVTLVWHATREQPDG